MKKTLVALAVAAVAASASATTVYNQDGTKLDVSGSIRVKLGKFGKEQRSDLRNDGSRLMVNAEHELGNGLKALAGVQFRFANDNNGAIAEETNTFNNPTAHHVFAGFGHADVGTVTFGKQDTTLDGVQLSDFTYWGGNNNLTDYAQKSVKFHSAEWAGFSFGVDYLFGSSNKSRNAAGANDAKLKYGYGVSAFYSRNLAEGLALNLAAGYGVNRFDSEKTTDTVGKETAWRTSAQVVYGPVSFGTEYGQTDKKEKDTKVQSTGKLLVSAKYQVIDPSSVYVQWQRNTEKNYQAETKKTENVYIIGADYQFNNNVVVFVEYGRASEKANDGTKSKDNVYGTGLRVFF